MRELIDGVYHWSTFHEGIDEYVHSYLLDCVDPPVLIDPRVPDEGLDAFAGSRPPRHIYLTNRLHYRHSDRFREALGVGVWCHRAGLHHFTKDHPVRAFEHGDELPGRIRALSVATLCPEETAFHIPCGEGLLSIGDAIIRANGELGFVPDFLIGDDPAIVNLDVTK